MRRRCAPRKDANPGSCETLIQVVPFRVHRLDQRDLPGARPALDLLLARDGVVHALVVLIEHEPLAAVTRGESRDQPFAMLVDAAAEVRGDGGIDRAVAFVGHDIDARRARHGEIKPSLRGEADAIHRPIALQNMGCFVAALLARTADGQYRHCERSEAIHFGRAGAWIASSLRSSQ